MSGHTPRVLDRSELGTVSDAIERWTEQAMGEAE
jgi:hypothetical protein